MNTLFLPRWSDMLRTRIVGRTSIGSLNVDTWLCVPGRFRSIVSLLALLVTTAAAQSGRTADEQWAALKSLGQLESSVGIKGKPTRAEVIAKFIDQANQLRAFYIQYPTHASAKEAMRLEVLALIHAARNGDTVHDARRNLLVEAVRRDSSFPVGWRFEVVAWSQQVVIARQPDLTHASKMAAYESAARALTVEFQDAPEGYESLLAVARDSGPGRGQVVASELLGSKAPVFIKTEARRLLDRLALIGKPLENILAQSGTTDLTANARGKPIIVYSWSSTVPGSQNAAREMLRQAPYAVFVGICLDSDVVASRAVAANAQLPGTQYFSPAGAASPLAQPLLLTQPGMTYIADHQGIIRDVRGRSDLVAKLALYSR